MLELLSTPWTWWFSGLMIALVMLSLLLVGGEFGVSSNLRTMCSIGGAGKFAEFFDFDWKSQIWNIVFILGAVAGGYIANQYLNLHEAIQLSESTKENLAQYNISSNEELVPHEIFSWEALGTVRSFIMLFIGGFLIGFGSRYAGGCTSGHAISGLSNLQLPSLVAVLGFFVGGLIATWLILPYVLQLF